MSDEYQKHLFEAFERERSATVSGIQGTGLGLAIAKQLTDLMGGTLTCNSKLGVGTEFVLKLKLPVVGYTEKTKRESCDVCAFQNKRILLVEDNDLNREIAVDMLKGLGFLVEEATDGSIAVEKIQNAQPGYYWLVLMDIQMPYMDGYYATHTIRMIQDKSIAKTPIVAMTANAFDEDRKKAIDAGMNAHLSKPINEKQIIEISPYICYTYFTRRKQMQIEEQYLIGSDLIQEFDSQIKKNGDKRPLWPGSRIRWSILNSSKVETTEYLQMANEKQLLSYYTLEDFLNLNANIGDHEGIVNAGRNIEGVEISVFIREDTDDSYKISLRSNGSVNVAEIAEEYAGGGHAKAAGLSVDGKLDDIIKGLVKEINKKL